MISYFRNALKSVKLPMSQILIFKSTFNPVKSRVAEGEGILREYNNNAIENILINIDIYWPELSPTTKLESLEAERKEQE